MKTTKLGIPNKKDLKLQGCLELPAKQKPNNFAIFAHCISFNSNLKAIKR
jgi:hypothetical protein